MTGRVVVETAMVSRLPELEPPDEYDPPPLEICAGGTSEITGFTGVTTSSFPFTTVEESPITPPSPPFGITNGL
jgi:hypothetical protein